MTFLLSRVFAMGIAGVIAVALGLAARWLAGSDAITVGILSVGAFLFTLIDVRFWNAKDMANDILESEESSIALAGILEKVRERKSMLWARWQSSFLTIGVVACCALVLQIGVDVPLVAVIALTAVGYCGLGATAVLTWWMGKDLEDFEAFQSDRRKKRLEEGEWEDEMKRITETPKPDFSKDKHLKGYGTTRRIKPV